MNEIENYLLNQAKDLGAIVGDSTQGSPARSIAEMTFPSGGGDMDCSDWAFGFSISGAVVTVNSGKVRHGKRAAVTAAGLDITIGADQTWVFCSYTFAGVATIMSSTSEPVDTEGVHNHALYLVTLTAGVASVEPGDISHLGDIWLPGNFA